MSERLEVYRCVECGSMCAVLRGGSGKLSCCEMTMELHREVDTESHLVGESPTLEHNLTLPAKAVLRLIQTRVEKTTTYFGINTMKNPLDYWVYQELIWKLKPDVIVEIGNAYGGAALALAHLLDRIGKGVVIGVDINHDHIFLPAWEHPRIQFITGDACEVFARVQSCIQKTDNVLIIEDSSHTYENTLNVLNTYSPLITPESYFIVEDTHCNHGLDYAPPASGAYEAIADFLKEHPEFECDRSCESFFITFNPTGYLRRR